MAEEELQLPDEVRRYVDDVLARLDQLTFYELLGVPPTADLKTIKRGYFRIAGLVHPDRYFGKKLGDYRPKLEAIYIRLNKAFQILTTPERREDYDAYLKEQAQEGKAATPAGTAPVDPRLQAKRKAAQELLQQHQAQARAKALRFIEEAKRAHAASDFVAAANAYRSALTFSPNDAELKKAYAAVDALASAKLAESHARKAQMEERFGRWSDAVQSWQRVLSARPNDPEVQERLAHALAKAQQR